MPYSQKYTIVSFLGPLAVGQTFDMADWPTHITLADVFAVESIEDVIDELTFSAKQTAVVETSIIGDTILGETSVWILDNAPDLLTIHNAIIVMLMQHDAAFNNPEFTRNGFLPHITKQRDEYFSIGDRIAIESLAIIDMFPDGDWQQRKVISIFELGKK